MRLRAPGPVVRITLGLVFMSVSIVLSALLLNVDTNRNEQLLGARKAICETLALQVSTLAGSGDMDVAKQIIELAVSRSIDLLSAGLRSDGGELLLASGDHEKQWRGVPLDGSTPSYAQVPIFRGGERWATLEARFTPLDDGGLDLVWLMRVLAVVAVAGFLGFWLMMRRALKELDPSAVVPGRVRAAMNALAEGVMLLDERGAPVLVNESLCQRLGRQERQLLERPLSDFKWRDPHTGEAPASLPWSRALRSGERQTGVPLGLQTTETEARTFVVNVVPVGDDKGHTRGALVTFDDVTDVERKNTELRRTLSLLELAREEVEQQNRDLERLASRDPLTDCLNRRSFFARFDKLLTECRASGRSLACLMADIDHFKRINDRYGHATGDEVIKLVAGILRGGVREEDMVCRYGGEEFCIALPGMDMDAAAALAERLREAVQRSSGTRLTSGAVVTSSCGVSLLHDGVKDAGALVELADEALYAAKESGRNRVVRIDRIEAVQRAAPEPEATEIVGSTTVVDLVADAVLTDRVSDLETALRTRTRALRHRHSHDPTTNLPNRRTLEQKITALIIDSRRSGRGFGLLWLSLDTLPRLCNALGPSAGDRLLRETGKRLLGAVRSGDTVGRLPESPLAPTLSRLGTQEFGVLVAGLDQPSGVSAMVRRLFNALAEPASIDGHEVQLTCSVGVALYPANGADTDELLKNAGAACQFAHQQGERNSWRIYARDMNANALRLLTLETLLRHAIERDEFLLHYQPKVNLANGRVAGVEALIRWHQAEMGMVSPAEFVPVAEQAGLIGAIGEWALDEACRQAAAWRDQGFEALSVAVNVSAVQFRDPGFAQRIAERLERHSLPVTVLELELTESTIMRDLDLATSTIRELAGMGVRIAVDDFGTGHSSLSYLRAFPVHSLKIDRSFLNEIEQGADETLVAAIASMAHGLGLHVVAEGVERESQVPLLRRHRCHEAQGYLFCKPVSADGISDILSGRTVLPALRMLQPGAWRDLLRFGRRGAGSAERAAS